MKSIRKRFVAIILLAVMVFSDFQMSTSLAMDNSSAVEETEVAETDAANTVKAENRLNYILVESPYLESPNTQNIVVSWGDGTEQISNMRITVQKKMVQQKNGHAVISLDICMCSRKNMWMKVSRAHIR